MSKTHIDKTALFERSTSLHNNNETGFHSCDTHMHVERDKPFDPEEYFGKGWSVSYQHPKAHLIEKFTLRDLLLPSCTKTGETLMTLDERMRRMHEEDYVPLDMHAFIALWKVRKHFPESWKLVIRDWWTFHFVGGTRLCNPDGVEVFINFVWRAGSWVYEIRPTDRELFYNCVMPAIKMR